MFDSLKQMGQLASLMKDLPRLKQRAEEVKGNLARMTVTADAGGGAVRVTCNGILRILSIEIQPAVLAAGASDHLAVEQLILEATNNALTSARAMAEREFADAAREAGIPLPPGGLGGLM